MSLRHSADIQILADRYNVAFEEAENVWDGLMQQHMSKDAAALNKRISEVNRYNTRRPSLRMEAERAVLIALSTSARDWAQVKRR